MMKMVNPNQYKNGLGTNDDWWKVCLLAAATVLLAGVYGYMFKMQATLQSYGKKTKKQKKTKNPNPNKQTNKCKNNKKLKLYSIL